MNDNEIRSQFQIDSLTWFKHKRHRSWDCYLVDTSTCPAKLSLDDWMRQCGHTEFPVSNAGERISGTGLPEFPVKISGNESPVAPVLGSSLDETSIRTMAARDTGPDLLRKRAPMHRGHESSDRRVSDLPPPEGVTLNELSPALRDYLEDLHNYTTAVTEALRAITDRLDRIEDAVAPREEEDQPLLTFFFDGMSPEVRAQVEPIIAGIRKRAGNVR